MPRIEKWFKLKVLDEDCLAGYVYDDSRTVKETGEFSNGHRIVTSAIQTLDRENKQARTRNTLYDLGEELIVNEEVNGTNFEKYLPKISK